MDQDTARLKRRRSMALSSFAAALFVEKVVFAILTVTFVVPSTSSFWNKIVSFGSMFFAFYMTDIECLRLPLLMATVFGLIELWVETKLVFFLNYILVAAACYAGLGYFNPSYGFLLPGPGISYKPVIIVAVVVVSAGAWGANHFVRRIAAKTDGAIPA